MKKCWMSGILMVAALLLLVVAGDAFAGRSIGDAATSLKEDTITPVGQLAVWGFGLVGVIIVGVGILKVMNARKQNEPISTGVGMIIGGAALTALLTVVGLTSQSVVQEDPNNIEQFGE